MAELSPSLACPVVPAAVLSSADRVASAHWYAVYTLPRHEKRTTQQLEIRSIDHFLPLYSVTRRWQHRHAEFELPLFPGYLFVHISPHERYDVLTTPGVLHLVGAAGLPAEIAEDEIQGLRRLVNCPSVCPAPYLQRGNQVRFTSGALAGLKGTVVRSKGLFRVIVSVDAIMRSISVEIDRDQLQLLGL